MNKLNVMLLGAGSLVLAAGFPVVAQAGTVKIAYIDALSGPFAATGQAGARE